MFAGLSPFEIGVALVLVMILFGAGKLPQVFQQLGSGIKAFRDAQREEPPAPRTPELTEDQEPRTSS